MRSENNFLSYEVKNSSRGVSWRENSTRGQARGVQGRTKKFYFINPPFFPPLELLVAARGPKSALFHPRMTFTGPVFQAGKLFTS